MGFDKTNHWGQDNIKTQNSVSVQSQNITDKNDIMLLSHIVESEAGNQDKLAKLLVASVVINRTHDKDYPNSVYAVIHQKGQYQYLNKALNNNPSQESIDAATQIIQNGSICEPSVIYQSETPQGSGVYKYIQGTYFCYK